MNKLLDINNDLITNLISDVLPTHNVIKIKNRLLDGTYHVQSIGEPVKNMNITCNLSETAKKTIDDAYNIDKPLRLEWYGKYYIGLIDEYPQYQIIVKGNNKRRLYNAKFTLVVSEEGDI